MEAVGAANALEEVLLRNENRVYRAALAMMGSRADAEDVLQDAFVKLLEKQPHFESREHEAAWLLRVAVNLCKSRLRSGWWKKTVPLLESYPAQNDAQQELLQDVMALPAKYRVVVHLYYYEGYKTKEIAALTGRKEATVREQLTRARRMLRGALEGDEG